MQYPRKLDKADDFSQSLDLSSLDNLSLGPSWSDEAGSVADKYKDHTGEDKRSRGGGPRERRPRRPAQKKESPAGGERPNRAGGREPQNRGERPERFRQEPYQPTVEVQFFPEDQPFRALCQAVRNSYRTFELFEITRLILEKPERFAVAVKPLEADAESTTFYLSLPDEVPFENESAAIEHALSQQLESFFEVSEVEIDPPKGTFQLVHRCGVTGELLGPPNYHRYQQILQNHHASKVANMPFERFQQKLEAVREEEVIQEWIASMTKQTRYTLKEPVEGHPREFDNFESARFYLTTHHKAKLVKTANQARFSGRRLAQLPRNSSIRRSVESMLEQQNRFPLETANHLRGRLRRMNFAVYKKGSRGVSYVSAVKRKFRVPGQAFADSVQKLIDFLEKHPDIPAAELPQKYLGIEPEAPNEDKEKTTEAEKPMDPRIKQLRIDLRWLVTEGYVVEYSNGKLNAHPPREESRSQAPFNKQKAESGKESPAATKPDATTPEATATATAQTQPAAQEERPEVAETMPAEAVADETAEASVAAESDAATVTERATQEPVATVETETSETPEPVAEEPAESAPAAQEPAQPAAEETEDESEASAHVEAEVPLKAGTAAS